jgi:hypothetical protein
VLVIGRLMVIVIYTVVFITTVYMTVETTGYTDFGVFRAFWILFVNEMQEVLYASVLSWFEPERLLQSLLC